MYDICCIGHITLDKIQTPDATRYLPGGTAWYFSHAIRQMGVNYLLVTAVAETELPSVKQLTDKGTEVEVLPTAATVYFENIYGDNSDERTQRVLQQADPFTVPDVAGIQAKVIHLGPLLADDISLDVIKELSSKAVLALDAQGYLRKVEDQQVLAVNWPEMTKALQHITILKVNDHELLALTGIADLHEGAKFVANLGVKEVVITLGSKGSVIYSDGQFFQIAPYKPKAVVDATGCGDTYMAGYLARRIKGDSIADAGKFASAMAALKIEQSGAFTGSEADVLQMMEK
ncbi:PfkB family carbohydrate kinase [Mucilaginibacter sp. RS28]|uniref:PfkB family carbohydrate kinase n=1 Tax=Mucilaginibacter straminoryzae TaxID=2932774 RepID=A0A9X2BBV9_9SPHI|nr:PfkB family carbohydrate kinase [Mucilaginibacter straminoryzae]MCJ8210257.1 PfkB family carbohydrate kinase [Mucilaginibacter straminoryzae]